METTTDKSKVMAVGNSNLHEHLHKRSTTRKGEQLKYLEAFLQSENSATNIRIKTTTTAMARLDRTWCSFTVNCSLCKSLSSHPTLGGETSALPIRRGESRHEYKSLRKLLRISYRKHRTDDWTKQDGHSRTTPGTSPFSSQAT